MTHHNRWVCVSVCVWGVGVCVCCVCVCGVLGHRLFLLVGRSVQGGWGVGLGIRAQTVSPCGTQCARCVCWGGEGLPTGSSSQLVFPTFRLCTVSWLDAPSSASCVLRANFHFFGPDSERLTSERCILDDFEPDGSKPQPKSISPTSAAHLPKKNRL